MFVLTSLPTTANGQCRCIHIGMVALVTTWPYYFFLLRLPVSSLRSVSVFLYAQLIIIIRRYHIHRDRCSLLTPVFVWNFIAGALIENRNFYPLHRNEHENRVPNKSLFKVVKPFDVVDRASLTLRNRCSTYRYQSLHRTSPTSRHLRVVRFCA